jgi:hypothetical protein
VNLKPGDSFIVRDVDGTEHKDIVHSIRYRSAQPEIRKRPTGLRRILRVLTPRCWRKQLPIVQPYQPANTEVIGVSEVRRRAQRSVEDIHTAVNRLLGQ